MLFVHEKKKKSCGKAKYTEEAFIIKIIKVSELMSRNSAAFI